MNRGKFQLYVFIERLLQIVTYKNEKYHKRPRLEQKKLSIRNLQLFRASALELIFLFYQKKTLVEESLSNGSLM